MIVLRQGSRGPDVMHLQTLLNSVLGRSQRLVADGVFGKRTEEAVKRWQRVRGIRADGIAGPATWTELGLGQGRKGPGGQNGWGGKDGWGIQGWSPTSAVMPKAHIPRPGTTAKIGSCSMPITPSSLRISASGLDFIYRHEARAGVSNHLHWPQGASGVTLGPGYDMKERTKLQITADMGKIGLIRTIADKIGDAAKLQGTAAEDFARNNRRLVTLTEGQEKALLNLIVPSYEAIVRRNVTAMLTQYEYDALVSFAYNPGGQFLAVARHLNKGRVVEAMNVISTVVKSKGSVLPGLVTRRKDEIGLYLRGEYR